MLIRQSNPLIERIARLRYGVLAVYGITAKKAQVEYECRRWYLRDAQGNVMRIAKSYFEVMQPRQMA